MSHHHHSLALLLTLLTIGHLVNYLLIEPVDGGCHKKKIIYKKIKIKLPFLATKKIKVIEKFKVPFQVLVAVPFYFKFPIKVRCGKKKKSMYIKMDFHTKMKKYEKDHDDDDHKHKHDDDDDHHKHKYDSDDSKHYDDESGGLSDDMPDDVPHMEDIDDISDKGGDYDQPTGDIVDDDDDDNGVIKKKKKLAESLVDGEEDSSVFDHDDETGEEHVEMDSNQDEPSAKKVSYGNTEEHEDKGYADDEEEEENGEGGADNPRAKDEDRKRKRRRR